MKKSRPGEDFEAAFQASVPKGVHLRRLRTPTAMGFVVPQLVRLIEELCAALRRPVPDHVSKAARFRFTPRSGVDFLLTAPCGASELLFGRPLLCFALELKSVEGGSLPFAKVDEHQEKDLRESAAAGHIAGLVVEYRMHEEVWFVPIAAWEEYKGKSGWKSLSAVAVQKIGMQIHRDTTRGRTKIYWDVRGWLERCGVKCRPGTSIEDAPLFALR